MAGKGRNWRDKEYFSLCMSSRETWVLIFSFFYFLLEHIRLYIVLVTVATTGDLT